MIEYYEAFTLPDEFSNFHLGYQYEKDVDGNMKPFGRGLGFTVSTSQEGGNYKAIGYNFGDIILRHHKNDENNEISVRKIGSETDEALPLLDLDLIIKFKPNDEKHGFTTELAVYSINSEQKEKIQEFLNRKR